jgi:23S rRNA (pseudouridine1915-N3)-methyltransferase
VCRARSIESIFCYTTDMKITIITIGKKHALEYEAAITDFTVRAQHYFETEWLVLPACKNNVLSEEVQKQEEGERILKQIKKEDYVVLLDERGNTMGSTGLAEFLEKLQTVGTKKVYFVIGGAFGVSRAVLMRANFTLALSKLVFPHQLVRLILIEQLYRAGTILRGEKYHHQ